MGNLIKLISWNVNGIRAAERKGFVEWVIAGRYQIIAVQETKISHPDQLSERLRHPDGFISHWHSASEKKGYSGVMVYTQPEALTVKTDFGTENLLSREGRVIELAYPEFTFLNIYFPNGGSGKPRLEYKLEFYDQFLRYVVGLVENGRKVVFCGDVNTAHQEIDLARPKENRKSSGFMPIECEWLDRFEAAGFVDTYRALHPEQVQYSWWDQKTRARDRNIGWRIDYFYVSENLRSNVKEAFILDDQFGSDHAPVGLTLEF